MPKPGCHRPYFGRDLGKPHSALFVGYGRRHALRFLRQRQQLLIGLVWIGLHRVSPFQPSFTGASDNMP
jgi:hypothetical protein